MLTALCLFCGIVLPTVLLFAGIGIIGTAIFTAIATIIAGLTDIIERTLHLK